MLVQTPLIQQRSMESELFNVFVQKSMARFLNHDWGDVPPSDKKHNDLALLSKGMILGAYTQPITGQTIYIITDPGHHVTTILFPEEY